MQGQITRYNISILSTYVVLYNNIIYMYTQFQNRNHHTNVVLNIIISFDVSYLPNE